MTVSPGFTPANANVSAGLRSASRCLSSAGRALSATAALIYAGIDGAAEASDAVRAESNNAAVLEIAARLMDPLLLRACLGRQWRDTLTGAARAPASPCRAGPSQERLMTRS